MWKKYLVTLNFGIGGDRVENFFWRATNLPKMTYLEHVIILYDTNIINKESPFDIAECLIEIGKYFKERSRNIKIVTLTYFLKINIGLSTELSLAKLIFWLANALSTGSVLLTKSMAGSGKMACLTLICILKICPLD